MKILKWVVGVPVALFLGMMALGAILKAVDYQPSQKSMDRDAIALCWEDQGKKSLTPGEARSVATMCEGMEARFVETHKFRP